MDILYPVLVLTLLALVFAVAIVICGKKLAVKEDPKVAAVQAKLAGANCGACGKAGCADFAKALVSGEVKVSACNATSAEAKAEIAAILGSDGDVGEETVVVCACSGGNACEDKYEYQGYGDCPSIELVAGGRKLCPSGCIGMAKCADLCQNNAITVVDGVAVVDQSKCGGCGVCVLNCPKHIIKRIPKKAKVYVACSSCDKGKEVRNACKNGCIGCGLCAKNCPENAITMVNNLPQIDYDKCSGCLTCVAKCPAKVIKTL